MLSRRDSIPLFFILAAHLVKVQGQCDPTKGSCPPIPGFTGDYSVDFTKTGSLPSEWIQADYEPIGFGPKGVEFPITDPTIAPYIWTNAYMHYGHVEVVMQSAPGIGVISSAVLMSDDLDEIDWEFSGNDFGQSKPTLQTNWFGKGITGSYDRGTQPHIATNMTTNFHTFTLDWLPDSLTWSVDGKVIRTIYAKDGDANTHQYPQTPARFHLGAWDAGGPKVASGTANWAGGYTDLKGFPYTAYVKSVKISPYKPCPMYSYTDKTGSSGSVKCINAPNSKTGGSTSSISSSTTTQNSALTGSTRTPTAIVPATTTTAATTATQALATSPASTTSRGQSSCTSPTPTANAPAAVTLTSTKITCPGSDQTSYTTPRGNFHIDCSTDYANGDLKSSGLFHNGKSAPSFQACIDRCAAFADGKCTAVNFVGRDGSGACYLKSHAGTASSRHGVQGARLVKGPSPPSAGFQTVVRPAGITTATGNVVATATKVNAGVTTREPLVCNQDNCLRNLLDARYTKTASAFCSAFTRSAVQTLAAMPVAVGNCEINVEKISSACSCLMEPTGR